MSILNGLSSSIKSALETVHTLFFKKFLLKTWIILAFVALICGANWGLLSPPIPDPSLFVGIPPAEDHSGCAESDTCLVTGEPKVPQSNQGGTESNTENNTETNTNHIITITAITTLLGLLILFWAWVASRLNFVFLASVGNKKIEIAKYWKEYKKQGNSSFLWSFPALGLIAVTLTLIGYGILLVEPNLRIELGILAPQDGSTPAPNMGEGIAFIGAGTVLLFGLVALLNILSDLAIPIMAIDKVGFGVATWRLLKICIKAPLRFLVYLPLGILTSLGISITFWMLSLIPIILAIIALIVILVPINILVTNQVTLGAFTALSLLIIGLPTFLCIVILSGPFVVFYRALMLHYLPVINNKYQWVGNDDPTPPPIPKELLTPIKTEKEDPQT
jgi:hypothetical protein